MGKKGSKRKTRWRTLSIGAPPGEEDEEEGLRNGYVVRGQDSEGSSRTLERNGQIGYKPRRSYTGTTTSGYASGGSRSRRDDPPSSPAQPKIIFNEDEYTRITTPRQDVLFKKGYLSRKKPWAASTASTSATPSTTESQSASHSTADGSETNEDQQLLDRDSGGGEYPSIVEPGTQLAYGTFYDHASGYYYEYPVMLVGPPIPGQICPNVLAAVPCGPVPLRPIEWVNPAFVPKLSGQPYCYMNYQVEPGPEPSTLINAETTLLTAENANGNENESATGSVSGSGGEEEPNEDINEEPKDDENRCYLETGLTQQVHVPHVSQMPQQYMYPGHYMFGPSLVNVNGVTIQSGPMIRTNDVVATTTVAACAKRKKKKKRRKQRRLALGNTEDEEEEEYSSECDNGVTTARPSWTQASSTTILNRPLNPECQEFQLRNAAELEASSSIADTNDDAAAPPAAREDVVSSRPSSPSPSSTPPAEEDVRSNKINGSLFDVSTVDSETAVKDNDRCSKLINGSSIEDDSTLASLKDQSRDPENDATGSADDRVDLENDDDDDVSENMEMIDEVESKGRSNGESSYVHEIEEVDDEDIVALANGTSNDNDDVDLTSKLLERSEHSEESRANGDMTDDEDVETRISNGLISPEVTTRPTSPSGVSAFEVSEKPSSRPISPEINRTTTPINSEMHRLPDSYESLVMKPPGVPPRRKYSNKGSKFVREATPGPDLDIDAVNVDGGEDGSRAKEEDADRDGEREFTSVGNEASRSDEIEQLTAVKGYNENDVVVVVVESKGLIEKCAAESNEDSGFESQTRLSDHPITDAVTQWLRQANSPDVFLTSTEVSEDSETDESEMQTDEPPKNLQGNPMPALSVNDDAADDVTSSRVVGRGEFARTSVVTIDNDHNQTVGNSARRKKRTREIKRVRSERKGGKNEGKQWTRERRIVVASSNSRQVTKDSTVEDVGACEFTGEDSIAGMRVALSSRMISKLGDEEEQKNKRDSMVSVSGNACRIADGKRRESEERKVDVDASGDVRTFERGEIVVSISGKLLSRGASHEPSLQDRRLICDRNGVDAIRVERVAEQNSEEGLEQLENGQDDKVTSIEEPDVLECWEAETVEPVCTLFSRKIWQSRGISLDGEATEEDGDEIELNRVNKELVRKYYRLARESGGTSVDEEPSETTKMLTSSSSFKSRSVPNSPERTIESLCSEEIPIIVPAAENEKGSSEKRRAPVEEAFEVYESCYTGKASFVPVDTTKMTKSRSFYGQEGEGPIPCRAVCCNIQ